MMSVKKGTANSRTWLIGSYVVDEDVEWSKVSSSRVSKEGLISQIYSFNLKKQLQEELSLT